jgi:hypothetical protein
LEEDMKRIYEMTENEKLDLTDEEVARLIDYECALDGVPMLPPDPGPKPQRVEMNPDCRVYEIAGFMVKEADAAAKILEAFQGAQLYREAYPSGDYSTKYLNPLLAGDYNLPKIETKQIHSAEQWDQIKGSWEQSKAATTQWDSINTLYQKALKERAATSDSVWEQIRNARSDRYSRNQLREEFARYLDLADGNRGIAYRFLEKAKSTALADFPELQEEFCPPVCGIDLAEQDSGDE